MMALRDYVCAHGLEVFDEYVDCAPANDFAHRTAWRDLMDDAAKVKFKSVLVFKLDRAFRSVKHMHDTLAAWEIVGVGFQSIREGFDTRTPMGRLLLNLLATGRVRAGDDRGAGEGWDGSGPPSGQEDRPAEGNR